MNIRHLEAFRALMEGHTVTQAAEHLGISQPAVSKLIAALERECGFALFLRQHGRLYPSPEAVMLYSEVQRVFFGVDKVKIAADEIRLLKRGQLSVAALPAIGLQLLPDAVTSFSLQYPNVRIVLQTHTSQSVVDYVSDQQFHIGFAGLSVSVPSVRFEHLCRTQAVCVLPAGHELAAKEIITLQDLGRQKFISLASADDLRKSIDIAFERAGVEREISIETHMGAMACRFVAGGAGVSIVDIFSAKQFAPSQIEFRTLDVEIPYDIWIVYPLKREVSQLTGVFVDHVRRIIEAQLA